MYNMRNYFWVSTVVAMMLMAVSCNTSEIEEVTVEKGGIVKIPYSLSVSAGADTKVSYAGNQYAVKSGDALKITGETRTDITGTLTFDSGAKFTGDIEYDSSAGEIDDHTRLIATLVHADNKDESTYANGVALNVQEAVEKYSLLSTDAFNFNVSATADNPQKVNLVQRTAFVEVTVTFNLLGSMTEGVTPVEIITASKSVSGEATIAKVNGAYKAEFVAALPGGTEMQGSKISICEREVDIISSTGNSKVLANNNLYHVSRSVDFMPQLGDPFWSDGTYGRISHDPGVVVTGIIVFVNNYEDSDDSELAVAARALTEKSYGFGHALVMSLKNAGEGVKWATSSTSNGIDYITKPKGILATTNVSGYSNTNTQRVDAANTAATTAYNYRSGEGDTMTGTSGWFLPSIGQWVYSISTRGFGGAAPAEEWLINESYDNWLTKGQLSNLVLVKNNGQVTENLLDKSLNDRMQVLYDDFGCEYDSFGMYYSDPKDGDCFSDNYWSSSEYNEGNAIRMNFGSVETRTDTGDKYSSIKTNYLSKQNTYAWKSVFIMKVRPFLAF